MACSSHPRPRPARKFPLVLALGALMVTTLVGQGGCIFVVEDPTDWQVDEPGDGGAAGSSGGSGSAGSAGSQLFFECTMSELSCSCSPSTSGASTVRCNAQTFPHARCCGDLQYPQKNTDCSCRQLSCKQTSEGCECLAGISYGPTSTCQAPSGGKCCASQSMCSCGYDDCYEGENTVSTCSAEALTCGDKQGFDGCSN